MTDKETGRHDTDLAKAKKIFKAVGAQLREDPELGPNILETVKMRLPHREHAALGNSTTGAPPVQ